MPGLCPREPRSAISPKRPSSDSLPDESQYVLSYFIADDENDDLMDGDTCGAT
jgi:hypothetical protein